MSEDKPGNTNSGKEGSNNKPKRTDAQRRAMSELIRLRKGLMRDRRNRKERDDRSNESNLDRELKKELAFQKLNRLRKKLTAHRNNRKKRDEE